MVNIVYRSTDNDKWGPGKDAKLTIAEGDGNWWELAKAVDNLVNNPAAPVSIANIAVTGNSMMIFLTDGSTRGPFALPVAAFTYRPEGFSDGLHFVPFDIFSVIDTGLFMVLQDHIASAPFNPNAVDESGNRLYQLLFGQDQTVYDVGLSSPGKPGQGIADGEPIAMHVFGRDAYVLSEDGSRSVAKLITVPDDDLELDIKKGASVVATLTFASGEAVGVVEWSDDYQFNKGDTLALMKPETMDASAANMAVTFVMRRGVLPE